MEQCYAAKLTQPFTPDINVESGGVNFGITAAVSNVKSIYCGVSGGVQQAEIDYSSRVPNPGHEKSEVDAEGVFNFMGKKVDRDSTIVHRTSDEFSTF